MSRESADAPNIDAGVRLSIDVKIQKTKISRAGVGGEYLSVQSGESPMPYLWLMLGGDQLRCTLWIDGQINLVIMNQGT